MFYFLFWLAVVGLIMGTVGYPVGLWLWARSRPRRLLPHLTELPKVSVILPVYNEEVFLARKISNVLQLQYPAALLEIIVVSDGSDDRTEVIADMYLPHPQLKVIALPARVGKIRATQAGVAAATGSVLVFTNVRHLIATDCLQYLIPFFGDQQVGGVSGTFAYTPTPRKQLWQNKLQQLATPALYQVFERKVKYWESKVGSVVNVCRSLYALRRELYPVLPDNLVLDDLVIPVKVSQQGLRVAYNAKAIAYKEAAKPVAVALHKRRHRISGYFQLAFQQPWYFKSNQNPLLWRALLHKFSRLVFPVLFFMLFISNLFIADNAFYQAVLLGQLLFYGLCLVSLVFKKLAFFYLISQLNMAVLQGFYKYLRQTYVK